MVVRHRQTWKLREHHLLAPDPSRSDSGIDLEGDNVDPLSAGDPLRSYFPTGTLIKEHRYGIEVHEPGSNEVLNYQRASLVAQQSHDGSYVQDIIITGEVNSASDWSMTRSSFILCRVIQPGVNSILSAECDLAMVSSAYRKNM